MTVPRQAIALVAAIAVGAGIGAAIASTGHTDYEAQAAVLLSAKGGGAVVAPLLPNARAVATSGVLAGDVQSTLRLAGSSESLRKAIHATTPPHTELVVVSFTNRSRTRAQQVAQEIAVKLTQLIPARFRATTPSLKVSIFDQAHIVSHRTPDYVGNSLIGAAIGLVVGLAALAATLRRADEALPGDTNRALRERERRVDERIRAVSQRETALARRAGELAKRERALATAPPAQPAAERAPKPAPEPEPEPFVPPPEPEPEPAVLQAPSGAAERTLGDLERLVAANAARFPEAVDEWNAYLFYLRDYADATGRLPATFDPLIDDVFGAISRG